MEEKKKNKEIITVGLVLLLVIVIIGVSYAAFTFSKTGVTENAITTSAVTMIYTEGDNQISINNAVPITEEVGRTLSDENYVFDFTIDIKTGPKMPISYEVTAVKDASSTMSNEDVRLYLQKSLDGTNYDDEVLEPSPYTPIDVDDEFGAKAGEMVMDVGTVSEKVTYYYRLRMWVDSNYELSSEAKSFTIKVNAYGKEGTITLEPMPNNKNIKQIYTYNEDSSAENYCVTGEEVTCKKSTCFQDEGTGSCPAGTIIKYAVNDQEEKYFHVVHDDGKTMTLQQRENTTGKIAWINQPDYIKAGGVTDNWEFGKIDKGPLTALQGLEQATANWTNVNAQTYIMGTTIFKDNAYTGCNDNLLCTRNTYTLPQRKAKARMLTVQEISSVGCQKIDGYGCPKWVWGYLAGSEKYEGVGTDTVNSYWTANTYLSTTSENYVYLILDDAQTLISINTTDYDTAARAVVVIDK